MYTWLLDRSWEKLTRGGIGNSSRVDIESSQSRNLLQLAVDPQPSASPPKQPYSPLRQDRHETQIRKSGQEKP